MITTLLLPARIIISRAMDPDKGRDRAMAKAKGMAVQTTARVTDRVMARARARVTVRDTDLPGPTPDTALDSLVTDSNISSNKAPTTTALLPASLATAVPRAKGKEGTVVVLRAMVKVAMAALQAKVRVATAALQAKVKVATAVLKAKARAAMVGLRVRAKVVMAAPRPSLPMERRPASLRTELLLANLRTGPLISLPMANLPRTTAAAAPEVTPASRTSRRLSMEVVTRIASSLATTRSIKQERDQGWASKRCY